MIRYSVAVIDDDSLLREGIMTSLGGNCQVSGFSEAESALETMEKDLPDLVLLDINLPGMSGLEALKKIKTSYPDVLIVMITGMDDIDTVISAMKLGAHDYVVKPIHMESLEVKIHNAFQTIKLRKEVRALQDKYIRENLPCFIGESHAIQDVLHFVAMVAKSPDTPVLILGETGTGKELIASAIHYRSPNFKGPFITINCASIPKDLMESELFGYEKGAFSGAVSSGKRGLIEEAGNGTLFLDEIGDLTLEGQAKLLRFLEEGEFYRIGGVKKIKVHTRVVAATNKDPDSMIEKGLIRKDLYFRLGVRIQIPSLNHRREDILPIAKHFLMEFSRKMEKKLTSISPEAENALKKFDWQGNVRELRNVIEQGVLLSNGAELTLPDLSLGMVRKDENLEDKGTVPLSPLPVPDGIDLVSLLESIEKRYFEQALKLAGGNEMKAAQLLHLNHHTFRYRRRKLGIERS
ncbi:MAG: sigma-54-dependent transcriptional regulator [Thermodesulfobacteriota bacterium]